MTFSLYGLTGYDVQYWNGSSWVTVTGGSVTGNNKVWKRITFAPISTSKIRVVTNTSIDNWSRVTEVEAWTASTTSINWLVTDQLGTPRIVLDQSGSLGNVKRHDYLPFGEELFAGVGGRTTGQGYAGGDGVRQKFTQKERDNETGLDYFLARYYSSSQGRFTSGDPLLASALPSHPQTWNRYSYALNNPLRFVDPTGLVSDDTDYTPEFRPCTVGVEAGCSETDTVLASTTINISASQPEPLINSDAVLAMSLNLTNIAQPVLMNQTAPSDQADRATAGVNNLELALPDYYQLEINIAIPNKFTLTAVGVSLTGTLDRNGNIYGGLGPSVGKSLTGVSGAATANYLIDGSIRTVRNEDQLASFLSGHSFTGGAGFVTGSHGTWVPGNGFALGTGFYTPQIGAAYNYSLPLGNPFRTVGLMPRRTN